MKALLYVQKIYSDIEENTLYLVETISGLWTAIANCNTMDLRFMQPSTHIRGMSLGSTWVSKMISRRDSRHFFRLAADSWARSQLASSLSVLDMKVHREHLALITIHASNLAPRGSHPRLLSSAGLLQKCSNDNGNVAAQLNKTHVF